MRKTLLATASSALAAAALVVGAGPATAEQCVVIETYTGADRCMTIGPDTASELSSLGYGSMGTGSLLDLISVIITTGSTTLSVGVPNSTGSYAPGSLGSYGPEASIGELLVGSIGPLGVASTG